MVILANRGVVVFGPMPPGVGRYDLSREYHGWESQSGAAGAAFHEMSLFMLRGPGADSPNGAYVASRAAIGKNPQGNLSTWRLLGNGWAARSEPAPRTVASDDQSNPG